MRAMFLVFALAGCSTVPMAEFGQSIEETASSVVYAVAEPRTPDSYQRPPRPRPEPEPVVTEPAVLITRTDNPLVVAEQYLGYTETANRLELKQFMGIDPRSTEWCAAFVNSVLYSVGQPGSETVSPYPLMARSFTDWGTPVDHKEQEPEPGDVVIFPRGRQSWQGHVGFYVDTVTVDGKEYWQILGGNQGNAVSVDLYVPSRAIAVRRAPAPVRAAEARNLFEIIRSWFIV